jgi:hypothetical protein
MQTIHAIPVREGVASEGGEPQIAIIAKTAVIAMIYCQ